MQPLLKYGTEVGSVFDLLGRGEVDLTAALGWTLTVSPALRASLWRGLGMPGNPDDVSVSVESADAEGRTDLELQLGSEALVIVEAKEGLAPAGRDATGEVPTQRGRSRDDISALVDEFATAAVEVFGGDPDFETQSRFLTAVGLRIEFESGTRTAKVQVSPSGNAREAANPHHGEVMGVSDGVRGGT
jgi:hypothetical protein